MKPLMTQKTILGHLNWDMTQAEKWYIFVHKSKTEIKKKKQHTGSQVSNKIIGNQFYFKTGVKLKNYLTNVKRCRLMMS